jgi:hypothetical protein
MDVDLEKWSGEGEFTHVLVDHLRELPAVAFVRVEDADASRSEADYNFISNEIYVKFATQALHERVMRWGFVPTTRTIESQVMNLAGLESVLADAAGIGAPDYSDGEMLQYLRAERVIPPYQTRGYKLVELVRIYEVGKGGPRS